MAGSDFLNLDPSAAPAGGTVVEAYERHHEEGLVVINYCGGTMVTNMVAL
jgi:hypothetical protein